MIRAPTCIARTAQPLNSRDRARPDMEGLEGGAGLEFGIFGTLYRLPVWE